VFCRKPLQTVLGMGAADWVLGLLSVSLILHSNTESVGGEMRCVAFRKRPQWVGVLSRAFNPDAPFQPSRLSAA
jgi:hypothetical protein